MLGVLQLPTELFYSQYHLHLILIFPCCFKPPSMVVTFDSTDSQALLQFVFGRLVANISFLKENGKKLVGNVSALQIWFSFFPSRDLS